MTPIPERPVAERVFETAPGVFRIAVPTEFAVGDVNVYVLDGPDLAMIDTGPRGSRTMPLLTTALAALGRKPSDLRHLLLTHFHADHAGCARALRDASGCEVRIHPNGLRRLSDPTAEFNAGFPHFLTFLERSGFSEEMVDRHREHGAYFLKFEEACPGALPVEQDDVLTVAGGRRLEVHFTPGHSSDHTVFFLPDEGVLLAGDHVLPTITANPTLEISSGDGAAGSTLARYRDSLERVAALPARVVCPSHGTPYEGLADRCQVILAMMAARCEKVHALLVAQGPMTRKELSFALFGKVKLWEIFLTLSEVQAAVAYLEEQGRARVLRDGPVDHVVAL